MAVVAGVLALVLVAGCGWVIGMGGVGDLVARLTPLGKLAAFGGVLVLVAAAAWTAGAAVGPVGDPPASVAPTSDHSGDRGHGG
ncbi:hypothetical protein [Saccharothrix texasensis]|uniref:Uncharacterized protein n=1 Tax=Saccharothrix texasensis TaxID=103734 RepID=A0A3N1HHS7_9PSEU|nr:hypothetical protein [Saccharothrix texasensis]ROP42060.1 hypothetical protein EDD40_7553 [Saccharothrix texasensis]